MTYSEFKELRIEFTATITTKALSQLSLHRLSKKANSKNTQTQEKELKNYVQNLLITRFF